jgi:ribosome recycling factor
MSAQILAQAREKMEKAIVALRHELAGIRAGRASPALLEKIRVDYYGTAVPIQQLGTVSAPDARTLVVQAWDKGAVSAIEKAIQKSDLGLVPQSDGGVVRLNLPQLTAERRTELVRHVRRVAEEQRVAVRNLRREAREQLERQEKAGALSADEVKRAGDDLQKITDKAMEQIAALVEGKEREITEV